MAAKVRADESSRAEKQRYRVRNWKEYDRALVNRGSLTVRFDQDGIAQGWTPPRPKERGKPGLYSDLAMQTCLTIKTLFRLPYRATEGLVGSVMVLSGVDLPVPDHTHLSRPAASLKVAILRPPRKRPMHGVVDSTGLKIFGEGEWKVRCHGAGKRCTWRKIQLAVDEAQRDIIGIQVTTADWGDGEILPELLEQIEGGTERGSADGAYDAKDCHAAITERDARATIPPREWGEDHLRDRLLEQIAAHGMEERKRQSGYHRRSLAETTMFPLKQLGDKLFSRRFERQVAEAHLRAAILNQFNDLGMPDSVRVGDVASVA